MSDEALLELVRAHLSSGGSVRLPGGGGERTRVKARQEAPAPARATSTPTPTPTSTPAKKTTKKRRAARASSAQRAELLDVVEKLVKSSRGLSSSEVAKKAKVAKNRVTSALRELKSAKRVFQGGERRFARYAGDAKTATQASLRARKNAGGPKS